MFTTVMCYPRKIESFDLILQEIATRYPDVPLSTVLIAEKKFVEADLDRNGVKINFFF